VLESMLRDNMDEIVGQVASTTEAGTTEATNFVSTVVGILQDEAAAGRLDIAQLAKGDTSAIRDAVSLEKLGGLIGGGAEAGEKALEAMMIPVGDSLQDMGKELGGLDKVLGQILGTAGEAGGGILGAVEGLLGGGTRRAPKPEQPGDEA
jgi:hypothetical protein